MATSDGGVVLLDATDLSTVAGPVQATSDPITDLTVSPDGSTIVVGTTGGRTRDVVTVDVESAEVRTLEGHGAEVSGVAFSPDGSLLATGSDDRSIILWTTADWSPAAVLAGHEDRVRQLAFTADGSMLLSVSDDGTMRWWDVERRARRSVCRCGTRDPAARRPDRRPRRGDARRGDGLDLADGPDGVGEDRVRDLVATAHGRRAGGVPGRCRAPGARAECRLVQRRPERVDHAR